MSNPLPIAIELPPWLPRAWLPWIGMALGAVVLGTLGLIFGQGELRIILVSIGVTLFFASMFRLGLDVWRRLMRHWTTLQLSVILEGDVAACIATDANGEVLFANTVGERRLEGASTLSAMLEGMFAHPGAVLYRMQAAADDGRSTREDIKTHHGLIRLSVYRPTHGLYLWRLEEQQDRSLQGRGPDGISLPMLIASQSGTVLFANEAIRRLLGTRPRRLDRVLVDQTLQSGAEVTIPAVTGLVRARVLELTGGAERREIYLLPGAALPLVGSAGPGTAEDLDEFPVALMRLQEDGQIYFVNREARGVFGLGPAAQPNLADLVEGPGRPLRDWIADVAAGRIPGRPEILRLRAAPGEEAFVQISIRRLGSRGQGGLVAVISDATAMKTMEAQFVQSQKMQAIGQLAGGVAHDFNNLLTAISGHCDLLLQHKSPSDPHFEDLDQIRQNANRAAGLVRQLLAFSRKQTFISEVVPLADVLAEVTHLLRRLVGETVRLNSEVDEDAGAIRADRRQLEQVLINLVVNARDAMPQGGEIRLAAQRVSFDEDQKIGRVTLPAGDYAMISLRDTGHGIAPEHMGKIFEPFFTTKRAGEGTGLGLSTVYGIVKQTGGFIFCDSTVGEGTEFTLYFPAHEGPVTPAGEGPRTAEPLPTLVAGGVILLVEDEAPVRAFAARALRLRGFTVIEADTAEIALEVIADASVQIDVVVSDVILPGLDGPAWVEEALKQRPELKVIFISGYAEEGFADRQSRIAQSAFLPKPFSLDELIRTVHSQMG